MSIPLPVFLRGCLISITIACSRLRHSPDGVGGVENARSAFSTPPTPFFARRSRASTRREKAKTLRIRHALISGDDYSIETSNGYTTLRCIGCTKDNILSARRIAFDDRLGNTIGAANLTKHARTGTGNALLDIRVKLNQTEAHAPAFVPLEVIH